MRIWIDNTGLHGAGRCLFKEALTAYDIKALLQLSTLLVFAEKIEFGIFESEPVTATSYQFRRELIDIGLSAETLVARRFSRQVYGEICRKVAFVAAGDLPFGYTPGEREMVGLPPTDLPRGAEHQSLEITSLALSHDSKLLEREIRDALSEKAAGAIRFMLATSPDLRSRVARLISGAKKWNQTHTFELESYLRTILNDHLAADGSAFYAPAPSRGEFIERANRLPIEALDTELGRIADELRRTRPALPPVSGTLLRRGHGDPRSIITEALALRERAAPLRQDLARLSRTMQGDPFEGLVALRREIREIGKELRFSLQLEDAPKLASAFDIQLVLGIPALSVNAGRIGEWLKHMRHRSRLVVLTDIVKEAAFGSGHRKDLDRLVVASSRNPDQLRSGMH